MKKLGIASIVLVVLAALTFFQMSSRRSEDVEQPKVNVTLPKLKSDQIDELELSAPEKAKVHLVKKDGAWRVTEPVDAKADENAINSAISKLTELEVAGVAATLAKNHEKLEVDEAHGTHVIAKGGGKVLLDGFIGAYKSGSSMFRVNGQDVVAAVRGSIRFAFTKDVKEWRDRQISDLPADTVQKITFANKGGTLSFQREGDAFTQVLAKGEKKIEPLDANKVKGVVGTASNLTATDFAAAGEAPDQLGFVAGGPTVTLDVKNDTGESKVVYHVGNKRETGYYLRKDGDDLTYVVSTWIGDRLLSTKESFTKKEDPKGTPSNVVQVEPTSMKGMENLPPDVQRQVLQQLQGAPGRPPQGHP